MLHICLSCTQGSKRVLIHFSIWICSGLFCWHPPPGPSQFFSLWVILQIGPCPCNRFLPCAHPTTPNNKSSFHLWTGQYGWPSYYTRSPVFHTWKVSLYKRHFSSNGIIFGMHFSISVQKQTLKWILGSKPGKASLLWLGHFGLTDNYSTPLYINMPEVEQTLCEREERACKVCVTTKLASVRSWGLLLSRHPFLSVDQFHWHSFASQNKTWGYVGEAWPDPNS